MLFHSWYGETEHGQSILVQLTTFYSYVGDEITEITTDFMEEKISEK